MVLGSGIRGPGSGKNLFRIPNPGSRGQKGTGSWIPDPDPQHWLNLLLFSAVGNSPGWSQGTQLATQYPRLTLHQSGVQGTFTSNRSRYIICFASGLMDLVAQN
jgi:hypothetical protein